MAIYVKKDDRLPLAVIICKDARGVVVNIAGMTGKFLMRTDAGVVKVNAAGVVTNGAAGEFTYSWVAGDTDTVGHYQAEAEITDAGGKKMTFPNDGYIDVYVLQDIG